MKTEQQQIAKQLAVIDHQIKAKNCTFDMIIKHLKDALELVENCGKTYRLADSRIKRMMNQAIFSKLWVEKDGGVTTEFSPLFKTLTEPLADLPSLYRQQKIRSAEALTDFLSVISNRFQKILGGGWSNDLLVLLSEHDFKKYQAALRFKRQIAEKPELFPDLNISENYLGDNREIDEFGEMATKCVRLEQKRLTPEEVRMLIVEYQAGKTPIELSVKYGCHRITVGRILRRNGVEIRPPHYNKQVVEH